MGGVVRTAATQQAPTTVPVCLDILSTPLIMCHVQVKMILFMHAAALRSDKRLVNRGPWCCEW